MGPAAQALETAALETGAFETAAVPSTDCRNVIQTRAPSGRAEAAHLEAVSGHASLQAGSPAQIGRLAERVRPTTLARQQVLPALDAVEDLLPWEGIQRGATVGLEGRGATTLALAVAAGPSAAGSWSVAVDIPEIGLGAALEIGLDLSRFAVVAESDTARLGQVVAALVGAFDIVLIRPRGRIRPADARRLHVRARERGTVLLLIGSAGSGARVWPEMPDLTMRVVRSEWKGLGNGHGHLRSRELLVETSGRRQASRPRRATLLLDPSRSPVLRRHSTGEALRREHVQAAV